MTVLMAAPIKPDPSGLVCVSLRGGQQGALSGDHAGDRPHSSAMRWLNFSGNSDATHTFPFFAGRQDESRFFHKSAEPRDPGLSSCLDPGLWPGQWTESGALSPGTQQGEDVAQPGAG